MGPRTPKLQALVRGLRFSKGPLPLVDRSSHRAMRGVQILKRLRAIDNRMLLF